MNDVKIKDRKEQTEFLRIACNMAELGINYIQADLILRLQERLKEREGNYTITDSVNIHSEWMKEWELYFKKASK